MHAETLVFAQFMEFLPRHGVTVLDHLPVEPGAFDVMDRGDIDFARLYSLTTRAAFFVTRAKRNLSDTRRSRRPVDKTTGLRSDQRIVLAGVLSSASYPDPMRRMAFHVVEHKRRFVFLTNNFTLPELTIAPLSKCCWPAAAGSSNGSSRTCGSKRSTATIRTR